MAFIKMYDLGDLKDADKLLNPVGISIETGQTGKYVLVDINRYERFSRCRAIRRNVQTQSIRYKVFTLRSENTPIREIARQTGISVGTVMRILEDYKEPEETDQLRFF